MEEGAEVRERQLVVVAYDHPFHDAFELGRVYFQRLEDLPVV